MTQWLLALETSGRTGSLALLADGELVEERRLDETGRRHAQTLVAELDALVRRQSLTPKALAAVAVSRGPGSFTGLRVGIVCAKTLAWSAGIPLLAMDTFPVIAENAGAEHATVHVVDDAQRGDLFVGTYQRSVDGRFVSTGPLVIRPAEQWVAGVDAAHLVLGPVVSRLLESEPPDPVLQSRLATEPWQNQPQAREVGRLAWERLQRGEVDDVWTVGPFYLRASAAEEKWDATHGTTAGG